MPFTQEQIEALNLLARSTPALRSFIDAGGLGSTLEGIDQELIDKINLLELGTIEQINNLNINLLTQLQDLTLENTTKVTTLTYQSPAIGLIPTPNTISEIQIDVIIPFNNINAKISIGTLLEESYSDLNIIGRYITDIDKTINQTNIQYNLTAAGSSQGELIVRIIGG